MFRMSPCTAHTWQDLMQNIGKLSLAGLFLGGTLFLAHAYAETVPMQHHTVPVVQEFHKPKSAISDNRCFEFIGL